MKNNVMQEISLEYSKMRMKNERDQKIRIEEVYANIPAIRRIDEDIRKIGLEMTKSVIGNPDSHRERAEEAREKIEKLKMDKAILLTESNIPLDYMEIHYNCNNCKDTGYEDGGERCTCLKQKLVNKAYKMSNIENMLEKENFQTFNIDLFSDEKIPGQDRSQRENMLEILGVAEVFVNDFDTNTDTNLLFYGTTGLGKTFMSNCIAKALLDRNKIVVYQTAFTILDILERRKFGRDDSELIQLQYDLLFDADLLIVDDLGTETTNRFTNAEIFNIINTRLIRGKKTIISSNLSPQEISQTYTDRVFSRIFEKFIPLEFFGRDLRWEA